MDSGEELRVEGGSGETWVVSVFRNGGGDWDASDNGLVGPGRGFRVLGGCSGGIDLLPKLPKPLIGTNSTG